MLSYFLILSSILVLRHCFSGLIVSQLVAVEKPWNIDSLDDLLLRPELKIIVNQGMMFHQHLLQMGSKIANEIDARDMSTNADDFIQVLPSMITLSLFY